MLIRVAPNLQMLLPDGCQFPFLAKLYVPIDPIGIKTRQAQVHARGPIAKSSLTRERELEAAAVKLFKPQGRVVLRDIPGEKPVPGAFLSFVLGEQQNVSSASSGSILRELPERRQGTSVAVAAW